MNIFQKAKWLLYINKLTKDKTMVEKLKSRKLWVTVGITALTTLLDGLGIAPDFIEQIMHLAMTYLVAQGAVDTATVVQKKKLINE